MSTGHPCHDRDPFFPAFRAGPFRRPHRPHPRGVRPGLAGAQGGACRQPQHRDRLHGRHGLVRSRLLRLGDRHPAHRRPGCTRRAAHALHHAPHLLGGACGTADGLQCPCGGLGLAGQQPPRLPRLLGRDPAGRGDPAGDVARGRLRNHHVRQVAQHAGRRQRAQRRQAQLARAAWLRHLPRLHGRRDAPLLPLAPDAGQPAHSDGCLSAGLLQRRRLDGPGHPFRAGAAREPYDQALLPVHRQQRDARTAANQARRHGQVPGPLRRRLDPCARSTAAAPDRHGAGAARHPAAGIRPPRTALGRYRRRLPRPVCAPHGGLRRHAGQRRPERGQAGALPERAG